MKKICRLAMVLGTVAVFGFLGCTALTGNNKSGTTQSGTEGNTGGNENGNNTGENNQTQTVNLSTALSSFTEDEITALEESINTQILSSTNGVTGITATIDADKNLSLTYGGNASVAITPMLTDDGAIKLLETYANKSTVIASKKTELKNTADNFAIPNELAQKIGGNAAELKTSIKTVIENIPTEKFAYSLGNRAIYFKISDLDSSKLPAVSTQTPNAEIIPGVKRILRNGRNAIDFTESNAEIKIDFENKNIGDNEEYKFGKNFYRGGFKFNPASNVDFIGVNSSSSSQYLYETVYLDDFSKEDSEVASESIFDKFSKKALSSFPTLDLNIQPGTTKNLYGTGLDKILKKYHKDIDPDTFGIGSGQVYDAKDALVENGVQKTMFDPDNNYNTNAHQIDVGLASLLMNKGVTLKNVVITDENNAGWTMEPKDSSTTQLINSVVKSDMSEVTKLRVKGLVRFEQKSPKAFSEGGLTKVILKEYSEDTIYTGGRYDISKLGDMQDTITGDKTKNKAACFYLSSDKDYLFGNVGLAKAANGEYVSIGQAYIISEGTHKGKYKSTASNSTEYSNKDIEKAGNGEEYSSGIKLDMGTGTLSSYPLSRVNNIKLTPMQKLLLDNQHIYG